MSQPFPKINPEEYAAICRLEKFTKRLVFDVQYMNPRLIWDGEDDGEYYTFTASNGYQVISRSRMDIQTERLWMLGAKYNTQEGARSGTMVFSSDEKRDAAYEQFKKALEEWAMDVSKSFVTPCKLEFL